MRAVKERMIVITIMDEEALNEDTIPLLVRTIEKHKPDFYQYLTPDVFSIYYKLRPKKLSHIDSLIRDMKELILRDERFKDIKIGKAEGEMIFEADWLGRIKSLPLGTAANESKKECI